MLALVLVLVAALAALPASAQVIHLGRCPAVRVQPTFDVRKYMGAWYENRRFFAIFELNAKCAHANYTLAPNATVVDVLNMGVSKLTGRPNIARGKAYQYDPADPAKLRVKFKKYIPAGDYWVLGTDYTSYAAVFSCTDLTFFNAQIAWILTRSPRPTHKTLAQAYRVFEANGVNTDYFRVTDQTGCGY